jgi:hypothetical protein
MSKHALPSLRLAEVPDRITVLADAMRAFADTPGSPGARKDLDMAMRGCTDEEYEAAWGMVQREQAPAAGAAVPAAPAEAAPAPGRDYSLRDAIAFLGAVLRAVTGDTVITWAMAATVAVVAVDAAIVSYSHIYALATGSPGSGFETGIQPRLLPLSIDGVIAEASLVLLYAARHELTAPKLARCMLILGITATVAANVAHGLPSSMLGPVTHVIISALLSAWPAGAFIGSVEMAMQLVRAARNVADTELDSAADTVADSMPDKAADRRADRARDKRPDSRPDRPADTMADISPDTRRTAAVRRAARTAVPADPVAAMVKRRPSWSDERIAAECGVSTKTVKRRRAAQAEAAQGARVTA